MPKADPEILLRAMQLPPEEAIAFFKSKGYEITWNWDDMAQEAHTRAFTVAKATSLDILRDIRGELQKALDEGTTFSQFQKDLEPRLRARGWWGVQEGVDADGNPTTVQLGSPWRLKTIFQTNMQTAYMAGRERQMRAVSQDRPYWRYIAIMDRKTRQAHRELHGKIFRYDDPFWDHFYPPNGFNCRCRVATLSPREIERDGLKVLSSKGQIVSQEVADPNTGRVFKTTSYRSPDTLRLLHPDEGFDLNPSRVQERLDALEREKLKETEKAVGAKLPEIRAETVVKPMVNGSSTVDKTRGLVDDEEAKAEIRDLTGQAKELGVKADFDEQPENVKPARLVMKALAEEANAGREPPPKVAVGDNPRHPWGDDTDAVAHFDDEKQTVFINPNWPWRTHESETAAQFRSKDWSSDAPEHFIRHEIGHWHQWQANPKMFKVLKTGLLPAEDISMIGGEVSKRATENPVEFVAEVYAGLRAGQKYSNRIMDLYMFFGGKKV
ncbi:MAG TPA: phage minor head protein [Candidatus Ozemobacteraceae bacterium]|nr:phage minor head protein [Candidatus Ozemobacteraceae bacterium]